MSHVTNICRNRKAHHVYTIDSTLEAGLVLTGSEVKSLRAGHAQISEAYVRIMKGEAFLVGASILPYERAGHYNHARDRFRKLLLHRVEIDRLVGQIQQKGITLVPLSMYFKDGRAKLEVGIAKGKKKHDKRAALKTAERKREADRAVKDHNRR